MSHEVGCFLMWSAILAALALIIAGLYCCTVPTIAGLVIITVFLALSVEKVESE